MKHVRSWMLCVGLLGLAGCGAPEEGPMVAPSPPNSGSASDTQVTAASTVPFSALIAGCYYMSSRGGLVSCGGNAGGGTPPYTYWWKRDSGAWTTGAQTQSFTCSSPCTIYFKAQDAAGVWSEDSSETCNPIDRSCL